MRFGRMPDCGNIKEGKKKEEGAVVDGVKYKMNGSHLKCSAASRDILASGRGKFSVCVSLSARLMYSISIECILIGGECAMDFFW